MTRKSGEHLHTTHGNTGQQFLPFLVSSFGRDHGIHRSKQLSSVSVCHAQVFARFSVHDNSIYNIIPLLKIHNIVHLLKKSVRFKLVFRFKLTKFSTFNFFTLYIQSLTPSLTLSHIHTHTHTHTHTHIYIYKLTHTHINTHSHSHTHIYIYIYVYKLTHTHKHTHTYTHIYTYI